MPSVGFYDVQNLLTRAEIALIFTQDKYIFDVKTYRHNIPLTGYGILKRKQNTNDKLRATALYNNVRSSLLQTADGQQ